MKQEPPRQNSNGKARNRGFEDVGSGHSKGSGRKDNVGGGFKMEGLMLRPWNIK